MKRKIKICVLMIMLFMALAVGSYSTYAFLTDSQTFTYEYKIGSINGTVTVTGDTIENEVITNNDLSYIHYQDDMIKNKFGLLDEMASEIKVSIKFNNSFPTRVKVQVPTDASNYLQYGLMYIVIDDTNTTKDKEVKLQVVDGNLQYAYEGETTWTTVVTGLTESLEHDLLRSKINEYNTGKLVGLYEDNLYEKDIEAEFNFRILVWGDYYNLSDTDKTKYLEMNYNFVVTAKVIQAIDQYNGGTLDYEND